MPHDFTDPELLGYLDEALPVERMTAIEAELRSSAELRQRVAALRTSRDHQGHSVSDIWRRGRLSCPGRGQLGSYLLGALSAEWTEYVDFHLHAVGCRYCQANLADLQESSQPTEAQAQRRQKFFQSSAGYVGRVGGIR
jgi:anti-sigma factor RsiW